MLELLLGVVVGVLVVLAAEAAAIFALFKRLHRKKIGEPPEAPGDDRDEETSLGHDCRKKGIIWILEPESIPRNISDEHLTKLKRKVVDAIPSRKYAKIVGNFLTVMDVDSRQEEATVQLTDCKIVAVSGSDSPSKKWAKKYPIKVEGKRSAIYNGSQAFYLYLETSWEKDAWCKALRQASCSATEKRYAEWRKDFSCYATLSPLYSSETLSIAKTPELFSDAADQTSTADSSSKVRQFLKKITKKASKNGSLEKISTSSSNNSATFVSPSSSEKYDLDDGRGCWNLLISRMFFDATRSDRVNSFISQRIQRSLTNMRTPSYIGEITCTSTDLGNIPPYISCMKLLPVEEDQVWGFEASVEYAGGMSMEIITRLELGESGFQGGILDSEAVTSALLGDLEEHDEFQNLEREMEEKRPGGMARSKTNRWASRCLSMVNSLADQVSQVRLTLSLRISSLRGNLRVLLKPQPTDQLWFAFTTAPELELALDASVGDYKLSAGHVSSLLGSRFKTAIQESLVLPNCECVSISWMREKEDDWVPRSAAPFFWASRRQEGAGGPAEEAAPPPSVSRDIPVNVPRSLSERSSGENLPAAGDSGEVQGGAAVFRRAEPQWSKPPLPSPAAGSSEGWPTNGRKAKLKDLKKKMSEKLEEKRRHIEEKGRQIVEKVLENVDKRA